MRLVKAFIVILILLLSCVFVVPFLLLMIDAIDGYDQSTLGKLLKEI